MTVEELANDAETTDAGESVAEVAETMDEEDVGAVVVEDDGGVAGIVTDRELGLAVAERGGDLSDATAGDVMTEDPRTLGSDEESLEASRTMADEGVRRMPVTDESHSLVGVVSLDDVVALAGEQLDDAATVIEKQSPGYEP